MAKIIRTDFDRFHDYGCWIRDRVIYFGSEDNSSDVNWEDGINFQAARKLIKNLLFLDIHSDKDIKLYFNSPVGDWSHGMAIYDVIKTLRSKVIFIGLGMVRSMGTIIMQACMGDRFLTKNCDIMIHDGYEGYEGIPKSFESWADYSKYTRHKMYNIYLEGMKKVNKRITLKKIEQLCSCDRIMIAEEAVSLGLADEIME